MYPKDRVFRNRSYLIVAFLLSCRQLKVIEDLQNALNFYGSIDGCLEHLSRPQDAIIRELLAFLAALLFNGNEDVQVSTICISNIILLFIL